MSKYDILFLEKKDKYFRQYKNELLEELSDANDDLYVRRQFYKKYDKISKDYSSLLYNKGLYTDRYKSDILHEFENIQKRYKTNPVLKFIVKKLKGINQQHKRLRIKPLRESQTPEFDFVFFDSSTIKSNIIFIAQYHALIEILNKTYSIATKNNEVSLSGNAYLLDGLSQIQRALFFGYIIEVKCMKEFQKYGTGVKDGMFNILKKYGVTNSYDSIYSKYYKVNNYEKRYNNLTKDDVLAVIPLLIACPKAFEIAKKEFISIELKS